MQARRRDHAVATSARRAPTAAPMPAPEAVPAIVKSAKYASQEGSRSAVAVPAPVDATPRATPSEEPDAHAFDETVLHRTKLVARRATRGLFEVLLVEDHPRQGTEIGAVGARWHHVRVERAGLCLGRIAMRDS